MRRTPGRSPPISKRCSARVLCSSQGAISPCATSKSSPGRRSSGGCARSTRSIPALRSRYAPFPAFCSARCRRIFWKTPPLRSASARAKARKCSSRVCSRAATAAATWWRAPASFRAAAAFSISSPPARSARCAPSSGATKSTPWAFSIPTRSAARKRSNRSACCPRVKRSSTQTAPRTSPRRF